ncbi:MAG: hypothetical protein HY540_05540, partial [Deltaproteobacteria bacterium]|nr:hypothetical protein [Deltaproteobacteria bacterium]
MPIPLIVIGIGVASAFLVACGEEDYEGSVLSKETEKIKPLAKKLTANSSSIEESSVAIIQWAENNLFHYENFGEGRHYGPSIYDDREITVGGLSTISIEDILRERAVGCHFASGVIITMLRSLGIAAEYVRDEGGHGMTYIPSIDRYIHGDHIADLVCIPAEHFILNKEELASWVRHPGFADPKFGILSPGFYAFEETMRQKYGYTLKLERTQQTLYVS